MSSHLWPLILAAVFSTHPITGTGRPGGAHAGEIQHIVASLAPSTWYRITLDGVVQDTVQTSRLGTLAFRARFGLILIERLEPAR